MVDLSDLDYLSDNLANRARIIAQDRSWTNIIDGKFEAALSGHSLDMIEPSSGTPFCTIARSGLEDVNAAVSAARTAFEQGSWPQMPAAERGRHLSRLSSLILEHFEELAALESRDTGKPLRQAEADITATARYFEYYGGAADKVHGQTIPLPNGFTAMTLHEPHGVVGSIIPWNYPAQIMGRVAGAALAMGNCLVIKPAEDACLSILRLAELALEAGIPAGVLNVITGTGEEAGALLSCHPGLDFITFTGSPEVGTLVQRAAAGNHIGCTLELGGKSPQILFEDADLDAAMPVITNAIIQNAGQTCSAGSRLLVHVSQWDQVLETLRGHFEKLVANRHDANADLGPLVTGHQAERVAGFLDLADDANIPVLAAGTIADDAPQGGYYATPTLFGPVPADSALAQEEVFGPVLSMLPFKDEEEAIALANGTPYGLVAGIWTRDAARSMRLARAIRAGQVYINGYGAGGGIELPFGGFKKSGHGREKGFEGLYEFSATKTIVMNHG
ncbi:MAG: aldehyde dehydrogenase family protein [Cohaesibacter sp.]|nr:aldehyde dehydrogenase family protein [Cohaesibacter sp.]MCV6601710.1 aldehyde dehydrogenase family protein [Cohaesibacter sp.]